MWRLTVGCDRSSRAGPSQAHLARGAHDADETETSVAGPDGTRCERYAKTCDSEQRDGLVVATGGEAATCCPS